MSLLDSGAPAEGATTNTETQTTASAPETPPGNGLDTPLWYWDENVPGMGNRPDYLPDKYKTVAEMAKAQRELEKKLGSAPEKYDFSKGDSWIEPEYEPFQEMADYAKSRHVPQDVMDKMLESVGSYLNEFKVDVSAEEAKLGENAAERLSVLYNWAKANLSAKTFETLSGSMQTAAHIEALEELRNKMIGGNTMIPAGNAAVQSPSYTLEEYRSELQANFEKYKTDPHYRKSMEMKLHTIKGAS